MRSDESAAPAIPLGAFGYGYVGVTRRLNNVSYPNGQSTSYSYFPNSGDNLLQTIRHLKAGSVNLSRFDYGYDKEHMIKQWTKQFDAGAGQPLFFGYDNADQLTSFKNKSNAGVFAGGSVQSYGYDLSGNRATDTLNQWPGDGYQGSSTQRPGTFNAVNQLQSVQLGPTPTPAPWNDPGDPLPPPPANTYSYDANGNTMGRVFASGSSNTLEWDGANRLTAITYAGAANRTEFSYDGLDRWTKIVEKTNGTVTSTKQFVWNGNSIAQELDANNHVTKRFFAQGFQALSSQPATTSSYYYTRDHLGSIREVTDAAGALRARYDYDPFGNTTKVAGDLDADFGYTGHYRHAGTSLYLAPRRAYDPTVGRWLSRDPIGEAGGLNLYGYVHNNPLNLVDPLGLADSGLHWGFVINLTNGPIRVNGGVSGGQKIWTMPPYSTSLSKDNPFTNKDVDGVFLGDAIIKIRGVAGSAVILPFNIDPNGYLGWALRGFGLDPIIPDFEDEFGPMVADPWIIEPCKY